MLFKFTFNCAMRFFPYSLRVFSVIYCREIIRIMISNENEYYTMLQAIAFSKTDIEEKGKKLNRIDIV